MEGREENTRECGREGIEWWGRNGRNGNREELNRRKSRSDWKEREWKKERNAIKSGREEWNGTRRGGIGRGDDLRSEVKKWKVEGNGREGKERKE